MRLLPYNQASQVPNVIVDGAGNAGTVLTLSHWPKSRTPAELKADTSTAIVFNYLDAPRFRVDADVVSNNHFDEDGLAGILALLEPRLAERHRNLLMDVAQAGDFGVFTNRDAARIAITLALHADPARSPLPRGLFALPYPELAGKLYFQMLGSLPAMLERVSDFRTLWEHEDARLTVSEALIEKGIVTIDEQPDLDLAIVRAPADLSHQRTTLDEPLSDCHPFALHNRTASTRLLILRGRHVELRYRYEGWVQLASRRPALRVDLSALATALTEEETNGARWIFDGVDRMTPRLHVEGHLPTSLDVDTLSQRIVRALRTGAPAWNPYE